MKATWLIALSLLVSSAAFGSTSQPEEKDVMVNIHDVYVPGGFDAESDVYVVASGMFPNSCYRWKEAKTTENKSEGTLEVRSTARVTQGMCLMVLVPYSKEINLGRLGVGEHKVRFMNGDGTFLEKVIDIK